MHSARRPTAAAHGRQAQGRAEDLAALNRSRCGTSGPCRDCRPGLRLLSEECTVGFQATSRIALSEKENMGV
jgi:hypothetical protein